MLKSDAAFGCCGSGILLNRLLESSLIFKGFSRLPTQLFALPLAVSMEAHYREPRRDDKGNFAKIGIFRVLAGQASIYQTKKPYIRRAQAAFTLPWLFF
ncbi:hypothetical protein [Aeromonas dhakensis]|uniref:hypothetical protein n=1 Tax=Aeromonas dhakensis TaxID=196024 RepID=UPI002378466F|nr:hypothetical protein [Aeromonas dhakensis]MDD9211759.1 hypothetical protein [Aeromonas dhakensis]